MRRRFPGNAEGVSSLMGYILTFAIGAALLAVALLTGQDLLGGSGDRAARSVLETLGSSLALRIGSLERVIQASAASATALSEIRAVVPIPIEAGGRGYTLTIGPGSIRLASDGSPEAPVQIPLGNSTPVATRTLSSARGQVEIFYNGSAGFLDFR